MLHPNVLGRDVFERPCTAGGGGYPRPPMDAPPPPQDQRDHRGKKRNLPLEKPDRPIFGTHIFGPLHGCFVDAVALLRAVACARNAPNFRKWSQTTAVSRPLFASSHTGHADDTYGPASVTHSVQSQTPSPPSPPFTSLVLGHGLSPALHFQRDPIRGPGLRDTKGGRATVVVPPGFPPRRCLASLSARARPAGAHRSVAFDASPLPHECSLPLGDRLLRPERRFAVPVLPRRWSAWRNGCHWRWRHRAQRDASCVRFPLMFKPPCRTEKAAVDNP